MTRHLPHPDIWVLWFSAAVSAQVAFRQLWRVLCRWNKEWEKAKQ